MKNIFSGKNIVDNNFYNREALYWWDSNSPLAIIRYMMNPIRFAYVIKHLVARSYDYRNKKVLDIGCGGGFLTEEIGKFGFETTGVDISSPSLQVARRHAEALNLNIAYHEGMGENLSYADDHFEMVFCLDVLEHVEDFSIVVSEVSRVLKPGGLFFFETINRTLLSYLIIIFFMQDFCVTRVLPPRVHNWRYFIKPKELRRALENNGLTTEDMQGIVPGYSFAYNLPLLKKKIENKISFHELCSYFRCHESSYKSLCYIGYARKPLLGET